jgi:hypothetical protein
MKTMSDAEVRRSVTERLKKLSPEAAAHWGRMSANQMVCHLCDSYKVGTGEKRVPFRRGPLPGAVMKWVALQTPLPWPKGIKTLPEVEQGAGGTAPVEFERDRDSLLRTIDEFCRRKPEDMAAAHPLFGPMKYADWMRWGYLHADHHLRQFGV